MHLRSKLTSEIRQKVGSSDEKQSKTVCMWLLCSLSFKKPLHLLKNKKHQSIFYSKNKSTKYLYAFTIQNGLGNMSD